MQKVILPKDIMATEKRNQYWHSLHAVRTEYREEVGDNAEMTGPTLPHWLEKKYGLRMGHDEFGNWTEHYDITDTKRFMLFQIKYFK